MFYTIFLLGKLRLRAARIRCSILSVQYIIPSRPLSPRLVKLHVAFRTESRQTGTFVVPRSTLRHPTQPARLAATILAAIDLDRISEPCAARRDIHFGLRTLSTRVLPPSSRLQHSSARCADRLTPSTDTPSSADQPNRTTVYGGYARTCKIQQIAVSRLFSFCTGART